MINPFKLALATISDVIVLCINYRARICVLHVLATLQETVVEEQHQRRARGKAVARSVQVVPYRTVDNSHQRTRSSPTLDTVL